MNYGIKFVKERKQQIYKPRFRRSKGVAQKCDIGCQVNLINPNVTDFNSPKWKNINNRTITQSSNNFQKHQNIHIQSKEIAQNHKFWITDVKFIDSRKIRSFQLSKQNQQQKQNIPTTKGFISPKFQKKSKESINSNFGQNLLASLLFSSGRGSIKQSEGRFSGLKNVCPMSKPQFDLDQSSILLDGYTSRDNDWESYMKQNKCKMFQKKPLQISLNYSKTTNQNESHHKIIQLQGSKSVESILMTEQYSSFLYQSH